MNTAMGMVIAMENTPHGLWASPRTTTNASTSMMITMMTNAPTSPAAPPTLPSSSRAIWPRTKAMTAHATAPSTAITQKKILVHRRDGGTVDDRDRR